jgi:hypothetical protein
MERAPAESNPALQGGRDGSKEKRGHGWIRSNLRFVEVGGSQKKAYKLRLWFLFYHSPQTLERLDSLLGTVAFLNNFNA